MKVLLFVLFLLLSVNAFAGTKVYFSPSQQCEKRLLKLIDNAKESIDIAVYSINNTNLVEALKRAHKRGVKIRILTDRTQAAHKSSRVTDLHNDKMRIRVHSKFRIEHNKFAVFDNKKASTGSYNWTNPATKYNSENCVFFTDNPDVVNKYRRRFNYLWQVNTRKASEAWFEKHRPTPPVKEPD